ncbi:hypothetical protein [Thauera sinica]|uniref:Transmembrane protein n=1 Tax=Thauera sinica TaxID=2665146 RepID=A0ABW1APF6_9RHOO|nr:hypothetical protein [Thauera sp. K11]ATE60493.1 hypothetical protein CCZ27_11535 [Thauera sp. K11]
MAAIGMAGANAVRALSGRLRRLARGAGWAGGVGVGLIVAALAGGLLADGYIDDEGRGIAHERARLMRAPLDPAAGRIDSDRARLERFYAQRFPGEAELPARLGRLYAAAQAQGVEIRRVDYRITPEPATPLKRVVLALPVRGDFPHIHAWLSAVLVDMPELALEGLSIKRAGGEANTLETEIRLAIFVGGGR